MSTNGTQSGSRRATKLCLKFPTDPETASKPVQHVARSCGVEVSTIEVENLWTKVSAEDKARELLRNFGEDFGQAMYHAAETMGRHELDNPSRRYWGTVWAILRRWRSGVIDGDRRQKSFLQRKPQPQGARGIPVSNH